MTTDTAAERRSQGVEIGGRYAARDRFMDRCPTQRPAKVDPGMHGIVGAQEPRGALGPGEHAIFQLVAGLPDHLTGITPHPDGLARLVGVSLQP